MEVDAHEPGESILTQVKLGSSGTYDLKGADVMEHQADETGEPRRLSVQPVIASPHRPPMDNLGTSPRRFIPQETYAETDRLTSSQLDAPAFLDDEDGLATDTAQQAMDRLRVNELTSQRERLNDELRGAEETRRLLGDELSLLRGELKSVSSELQSTRVEADRLKDDLDSRGPVIEELEERNSTLSRRLTDAGKDAMNASRKADNASAEMGLVKAESAQKDEHIQNLYNLMTKERREGLKMREISDRHINDLRTQLASDRSSTMTHLCRAIDRWITAVHTYRGMEPTYVETMTGLRDGYDALREETVSSANVIVELTNQLRVLESELIDFKDGRSLAERDEMILKLKAAVAELNRQKRVSDQKLVAAEEAAANMREALGQARSRAAAAEKAARANKKQSEKTHTGPSPTKPAPRADPSAAAAVQTLQAEMTRVKTDSNKARAKLTAVKRELADTHRRLVEAERRGQESSKVSSHADDALRVRNGKLEARAAGQAKTIDGLRSEMSAVEKKAAKLEETNKKLESKLKKTSTAKTQVETARDMLETELQASRAIVADMERSKREAIESRTSMGQVRRLNAELTSKVERENEQKVAMAAELQDRDSMIESLRREVAARDDRIAALETRAQTAESRATQHGVQIQRLEADLAESRARPTMDLDGLRETQRQSNMASALQDEVDRLRDMLGRKDKILINLRNELALR